ncbi:putative transferase CAF17 homolog, mitochondrial [Ornithodoros turicata]|uniref:putative transferase CAF17 homolog, mitochondrial n=1 Tax=Ornithodoros turicata TaxID=34597 RepID=UPI0031387090
MIHGYRHFPVNVKMQKFLGRRFLPRWFCSKATVYCERLAHRKLILLEGKDTLPFLQGILTNDTRHLANDPAASVRMTCMYSMMLNNLGRVLYDLILYKVDPTNENKLLLECDEKARSEIMKLLSIYKLRKDVKIHLCDDTNVWAVFHPNHSPAVIPVEGDIRVNHRDPRLDLLGQRVLAHSKCDIAKENTHLRHSSTKEYTQLRYRLGVSEGVEEHPPGNCFPLECNADYMSGVSFHKGCYVGQELTARTHHTGVVRKRIMPIVSLDYVLSDVPCDAPVKDQGGHTVGKYRAGLGQCGLGLLRVEESVKAQVLTVNSVRVSTARPGWWPRKQHQG